MNNVDRHIGSRIRLRRKILNISQYTLAIDLKISFQQLQKYESGENRIASSRLYEISKILKTYPQFFFEGLNGVLSCSNMQDLRTMKLVHIVSQIQNPKVKEGIISLITELKNQ